MDFSNLEWSGWTKNEYPINTCSMDGYTATIQAVDVCAENGYRNRMWKVKHGDVVIAHGYTLGSKNAYMFCELALHVSGVLEFGQMMNEARAAKDRYNPRAG
jgi:hypothetical protein